MLITRYILICLCSLFSVQVGLSQTRTIDNLKLSIRLAGNSSYRMKALIDLCELGYSLHPDTLLSYANQMSKLAGNMKNQHLEIQSHYYISGALTTKGLIDSSMAIANRCIDRLITSGKEDWLLLANLYNQKGRCYMRKNNYKEAIDMGYRTIATGEKAGDALVQIKGKTLIGWAYLELGHDDNSLSWHMRAVGTTTDSIILQKYGILFANIALNYSALGKPDSATFYINKAVIYSRKYENLFALSNSLAIKAQLLVRAGKASQAEAPLSEAVAIRKLIGDPFYIVSDMSQLGIYYANNGQPEKGIAICKDGISIAMKYGIDTKLFFLYSSLAENYRAMGNMEKYAEVLSNIISLKDSVHQKNTAASLSELRARFDLQKKETLIVQQKLDLQKKNYLIYGSVLLSIFGLLVGWLIFNNYKKRQKMKLQKMQEDEKISLAIAITKAEENERKRIAADLHDNLGAYAAAIANNVEQIRTSPAKENALQELHVNSQSIVSQLNDTIWVLKKDNLSLTAISDRIKVFIQRINPSYPDVNIDVTEHINTDIIFQPASAYHLFQIVKEAINNSLKHSGAKNIRIFLVSAGSWKITIADDGSGFPELDKNRSKGNGIMNMKNRAREAGWNITWEQQNTIGTEVSISPTTN